MPVVTTGRTPLRSIQRPAGRTLPRLERPDGEILVFGASFSRLDRIGDEVRDDAVVERPQRRQHLCAGGPRGEEHDHGY